MLMSSLASIQAASVYTTSTVPIEKTYDLPAAAKTGGAGASPPTKNENDGGASPAGPATKTEEDVAPEEDTPSTNQSKTADDDTTASDGAVKTEPKD